jgi:sigma-B regulation protein RsbQ
MKVFQRNNVQVRGQASSSAPLIVFAHGFGCDQNLWRFVAPAFEASHRVVLFDHVGAGNSDVSGYSPGKYNSLRAYAADCLEFLAEIGGAPAVFVGHSVSGMIAVLAAIAQPQRFSDLVLICPSPCYINEPGYVGGFEREQIEEMLQVLESNYLGWSSSAAPAFMGNPERPDLGKELAENFCRTDPEIASHFARVTFLSDHRADLALVETPTLILDCKEDFVAPPEVGQYMQRSIRHSQLLTLDATGHCPNLSAPEETIAAIRNYLKL